MLFNILFLVLLAAVAYFHYTQGFFSAGLSAILSIVAAAMAIGYHETVTPFLTKLPDQADAIALVGIFAIVYLVGRLLFDNLVPGNVRFPLMAEKVGAGALGVVAGLFSTGLLAVAAQTMPFGPDLAGYSRQPMSGSRPVVVAGDSGRSTDAIVGSEVESDTLGDRQHQQHLLFDQDDLVLGFTRQLSDPGGALSNDAPFEAVHPDYLTEMFGQRLGVPGGVRRLIVSPDRSSVIRVGDVYAYTAAQIPAAMQLDGVLQSVRGDEQTPDVPGDAVLAVVRVTFARPDNLDATDPVIRISPGSVRLKAGSNDYYPLGTMVGGVLLLKDRIDDPLVIDPTKGATVDFVFGVSPDDLNIESNKDGKKQTFKPGSFIDIQRYAQADLSGTELAAEPPSIRVELGSGNTNPTSIGGVMRQNDVITEALKRLNRPVGAAPSNHASNSPGSGNRPAGSRQDNEFLPDNGTGHMMGL
jgi:hypothetical protein